MNINNWKRVTKEIWRKLETVKLVSTLSHFTLPASLFLSPICLFYCLYPSLRLFISFTPCSQSLQLTPLLSLHHPMAKHTDLDSLPPLMWVMWPLRSRCPHTAGLILSESRHSPQRGPVINPAQPRPPLDCLYTWCITTPTPIHPRRFTQTCMCGRGPMMQEAL